MNLFNIYKLQDDRAVLDIYRSIGILGVIRITGLVDSDPVHLRSFFNIAR